MWLLESRQLTVYWKGTRGVSWALDMAEVLVGRGGDAQLDLSPSDLVSRHHAVISSSPQGHIIADLDTRNGTRVNGEPITRTLLEPGDRISIGDHVLVYEAAEEMAQSLAGAFSFWGAKTTVMPTPSQLDEIASQHERVRRTRLEIKYTDSRRRHILLDKRQPVRIGTGGRCDIQIPRSGVFGGGLLAQIGWSDVDGWVLAPLARQAESITVEAEALDQPMMLDDGDLIDAHGLTIIFKVAEAQE